MRYGWRILESLNGLPHSLMHNYINSRLLLLDMWMEAEGGTVTNPGSGGQEYEAGWHHMVGIGAEENALKYMKRFTRERDLVLVHIQVDDQDSWEKPGPNNVMLTRRMRIPRGSWRRALGGV